jgi:hypothetical protein
MRTLVLRLLLLAVFFNTAVGMPVHSASHLRQGFAPQALAPEYFAALWGGEDRMSESAEPALAPHQTESAETVCAWCMGHAAQAVACLASPRLPLAVPARQLRPPPRTLHAAFSTQNRWAFASRDPPLARHPA